MKTKNISFIIFSLALLIQPSAKTFSVNDAVEALKNGLSNKFAFMVYGAIIVGVGQPLTASYIEPYSFKLRKRMKALTLQEQNLDTTFQHNLHELEKAKFNLAAAQHQYIDNAWPKYKKNIQKEISRIESSDFSIEDKQKQVEILEKKLKIKKLEKNQKSNESFEQILKLAGMIN